MIEILASILASDLLQVGADVQRMLDAGVDSMHVDIMDAHFVPNLSFGPAMVSALKKAFPTLHQDVHLMMDNPDQYVDEFAQRAAQGRSPCMPKRPLMWRRRLQTSARRESGQAFQSSPKRTRRASGRFCRCAIWCW